MDDELRRRARAARAEVEAKVDVEAELAGRRAGPTASGIDPIAAVPPRGRILAVAGSIAAVAIAIVGGIVLFQGTDSIETSEPSAPIVTTNLPAPVVPTTTAVGPTTTVVPTTSALADTTTTTSPGAAAEVSYLDPPANTTLTPLGAVPVPEPAEGMYQVAIGDLGVAVSTRTYEPATARLDIIGWDGTTRTYDDDIYDNVIAYGPGDVVYTTTGEPMDDFAVVAVPVSGDRAGEVVASEPANVNEHLEYPPASYGHAATGVAMRRYGGKRAIGYVDAAGNPTTLDSAPTFYDSDTHLLDDGRVSVIATTGASWTLSVDAHPDGASPYVGPSPAAPTTGGDGVFWTHIGPDLAPDIDFGEPSQWVVARLHPGGSATWWSLPEAWTIAASDIWGTVAVRQLGEQLEVALVDFAAQEQPTPTTTTTSTSTTTTSTPATVPTTVPSAAVSWRSLPWEATRIERACADEEFVGCTQILVDRDGSIVSYDPTTRTLTRHSTPTVTAQVDDGLGDVYLHVLGPDQVVYLNVDAAMPGDGAADLLAVSLAPGDVGRQLGRWPDITDRVGDQDLVATRDGLVVVDCCDAARLRPAPDADVVLPWVGRDGGDVSIDGPVMRTEVDRSTLTVHRENDLPTGTRSWTFEPPSDWQARGMPTVLPTFDGGFVATTFDGVDQTVIRGWIDGTIDMITIDATPDFASLAALDPSGRVTVADGERFARFEPFAERAEFWAGRPEYGGDGIVALPDIDTVIDDGVGWARSPIEFGNAVAGRVAVNERRMIEHERTSDSEFRVSVVTANFFDDSVFASRIELILRRDEDGRFRFVSGQWGQVCRRFRSCMQQAC